MLKHVGRIANNQKKAVIAYRTLPNDPNNCLVVMSESLGRADHDDLMKLVESNAGQSANELYEAMARTYLSDGRQMLAGFHQQGHLRKYPTSAIEMTPNANTTISLAELNQVIAQQKGVSVADLAVTPASKSAPVQQEAESVTESPVTAEAPIADPIGGVLDDAQLAASYRSQADSMFKEAKRLREEAEKLSPTKKATKKKAEA
jgi:hypothetical protein